MARNQAETLVNANRTEGIDEIRKSAIIAILFVVGLFAGLVLWLMRSSHPAMTAASAQSLGALRAPDVSAIDPNEMKHSDALPTPMPARPQNVATQPALDVSALAQNPNQFSQTSEASAPSTGSTTVADAAKQQALEANRLRRQQIADARDSDMTVKLPDSEPSRLRSDAPPVPSGQVRSSRLEAPTTNCSTCYFSKVLLVNLRCSRRDE